MVSHLILLENLWLHSPRKRSPLVYGEFSRILRSLLKNVHISHTTNNQWECHFLEDSPGRLMDNLYQQLQEE